jgi:hypothetical protein
MEETDGRKLAVGLTLLIPTILAFMFKPEIESRLRPSHHQKTVEQTQTQHEGLIQYRSRSELPPFDKMLSIADATVDMTGLDLRIAVHQYMSNIRTLIYKNIRVTLYLLDPESKQVEIQSKSFHAVDDLKPSIQKSIRLLCEEKEKLPPYMRGNLIIRLYDYPPQRGIIITDDGHENAWIKVEARPLGSDSNSRPSEAWYRSYDQARYAQFGISGEALSILDALIESFGKSFLLPLDVLLGWIFTNDRRQRISNRAGNSIIIKLKFRTEHLKSNNQVHYTKD